MRALITGGTGFVGSHLADLLANEGHEIVVFDREPPRLPDFPSSARTILGDVLDAGAVREAARGCELVFHLAARTDLAGRGLDDYAVNVEGTRNVAAAAREAGARRLVFFSSMLAAGLTGSVEPIDETTLAPPQSPYGESKLRGEEIVRAAGVPFTNVRPTLVYGPRERATMHAFLRAIHRRRFLLIGSDVLQSFAFVGNVVRAALDAALHPAAASGTFFVSDAAPCTLARFAGAAAIALGVSLPRFRLPLPIARVAGAACDVAASIVGHELPLSRRRVRTMTTNYVYSIERARSTFGYSPPHTLESAVRDTVRWYLERELL